MIEQSRKEYVKSKKIVRNIFIALIALMLVLIGLKILREFGGIVIFPVKEVTVYGNRFLDNSEVVKKIGLGPGVSMLTYNRNRAAEILKKDPRIESVVIVKVYPDQVKVYIKEKSPIITVVDEKQSYAVSYDGVVLGGYKSGIGVTRPILFIRNYDDIINGTNIYGKKIDNFLIEQILDLITELKARDKGFVKRIESLAVLPAGIYMYLDGGKYRVYFGGDLKYEKIKKLKALISVLSSESDAEGRIFDIDMSFSQAAVKIREQ